MEEQAKVSMKDNESKEPVAWSTLFCRLFACMSKEIIDRLGEEEGEALIHEAVRQFGIARGQDIARPARAAGCEPDYLSYLPNYDMGRADDFTADSVYGDGQVSQLFTQCGFAETWIADGTERYGKLYCDVIDPAIVEGFSADMECIHDKRMYEDGQCRFCFKMRNCKK